MPKSQNKRDSDCPKRIIQRTWICFGLIAITLAAPCWADGTEQDAPQHMMAESYFLREPVDQAWQIRIVGRIPSLPGCQFLLHDVEGHLLLRKHVPHGDYTEAAPLIIDFPKDGRTGDMRLCILGQQDDLLGPRMPISTLPLEVYGSHYFAAGHNQTPIYFKTEPDMTERNIRAYKGNVRVYEGDTLIADAQAHGQKVNHDWSINFAVKPNTIYRIDRECLYFRSTDGLLLVFDPDRWFVPDARLNSYNWWELKE